MKKVLGLLMAVVLVLSAGVVFAEDLIPGEYYNLSDYEAISDINIKKRGIK